MSGIKNEYIPNTVNNTDYKMLAIDENDSIVACLAKGTNATWISNFKELYHLNTDIPVIFRSMSQRKTVALCESQKRDFYYIDTGYYGNLDKRKDWHRVVKNGMQHSKPRYDMPEDRFFNLTKDKDYIRFKGWKKNGKSILLVTPSNKPCSFYGIDRDTWVAEIISELKKFTDRPIIIRDKGLRRDRIGDHSIYQQFVEDDIFAVVTYNSIAATEAIGFGIPSFTLAPNAADVFCLKDISKIETPLYDDDSKVIKWQHWLGYCQYTPNEMATGVAMKFIQDYNLL